MGRGVLYRDEHPGRPKEAHALKPNAQRAWDQATGPHAPSNVLGQVNRTWAEANGTRMFFGRTHHSVTPQAWAEQVIGFNITHALTTHLQRAIMRTEAGIFLHTKRGYTAGQDTRLYLTTIALHTATLGNFLPPSTKYRASQAFYRRMKRKSPKMTRVIQMSRLFTRPYNSRAQPYPIFTWLSFRPLIPHPATPFLVSLVQTKHRASPHSCSGSHWPGSCASQSCAAP